MNKLKITNPRHMAVLKIVNDHPLSTGSTVRLYLQPKPTTKAVQHILTSLREKGYLQVTAKPGRTPNQYTINDKGKEQVKLWDASNDK